MKISKLHIDQFRHLEKLDFDFTYPEDFHIAEKRGKPLDKICFIGQSATGKTSLLELIYEYNTFATNLEIVQESSISNTSFLKKINGEISFIFGNEIYIQKNGVVYYKNKKYENTNLGGEVKNLIPIQDKNDIIYFKSDIISDKNIELFSKNPIDLIEKHESELRNIKSNMGYKGNFGRLLDSNVNPKFWLFLIDEILIYRKNFTQKMSDLIHKGLLANQKKLSSEFEKWQKDNPNTLELFAEKLNPLLEKLNLEVDLFNTEYSIPIKNKRNDEIIPIQNTSTGTKGLLLSFLPLFKLDTKNSIILIDEPERSLYPDMQMDLMEYYQNLAPEVQFIVATHSPFIAASFEPEERFILYFDEKGKVAVRRGTSPIGDDPNDMLKNDFNLESLMNEKGVKAFEKYRNLKKLFASEKNEDKKDKLLEEILLLANAYKF